MQPAFVIRAAVVSAPGCLALAVARGRAAGERLRYVGEDGSDEVVADEGFMHVVTASVSRFDPYDDELASLREVEDAVRELVSHFVRVDVPVKTIADQLVVINSIDTEAAGMPERPPAGTRTWTPPPRIPQYALICPHAYIIYI